MLFGRRKPDLSTHDALSAFEAGIMALVREQAFETAWKRLIDAMSGPYEKACRRTADAYVAIDNWDEVWADMAAMRQAGQAITAFGIDLSGYGDGPEPALECAFYDDRHFAFSQAAREDILAAGGYPMPWMGSFIENDRSQLEVRGLSGVFKAVAQSPDRYTRGTPTPTPDYCGARLATWYIVVRVHHAIARDLEKRGMPWALPIVVGDHDFGPDCLSVFMARQGASRDKVVANILKNRAARSAKAFDRQTDTLVQQFRDNRKQVRDWPPHQNLDKRDTFVDFVRARERLAVDILGMGQRPASWEMDDAAFRTLLEDIRTARARRRDQAA